MRKFWKNGIVLTVSGALCLLLAWAVAFFAVGNEYVLPSPWITLSEAVALLANGTFYAAFFATLGRAVLAFALAFVLGGWLGFIAYLSPSFEKFSRSIVAVFRALPTLA